MVDLQLFANILSGDMFNVFDEIDSDLRGILGLLLADAVFLVLLG